MKFLGFILSLVFYTTNSFATIHEGVEAYLDFDENYIVSEKSSHKYLVVVEEEWSFPNYTEHEKKQRLKFEKALEILEEVMNSEEFKRKVLSYKRSDGKRLYQKNYLWTNSEERLTNEDVYDLIMEGHEKMIPNTYGEMNLNMWIKKCTRFERYIRRIKWCSGVVGSTSPYNSKWITANWKFYTRYETPNMVANIVHEWLHLLGFLHGKENMREEVPYVVGSIAGQVAEGILDREK